MSNTQESVSIYLSKTNKSDIEELTRTFDISRILHCLEANIKPEKYRFYQFDFKIWPEE